MKESEIAAPHVVASMFCEKRKLLESKLILERSMLNGTFKSVARLNEKLIVFVLRNENCYIRRMLVLFQSLLVLV